MMPRRVLGWKTVRMVSAIAVLGTASLVLVGCPGAPGPDDSDPCAGVTCDSGESCVDGECRSTDPCDGVTCAGGETCVDGQCVSSDPCDGVTCEVGETCVEGECVSTDPCDGVTCADGETCENGQCVGSAAPTLQGLDANKAVVLPFTVQAAYNDDTMFFHMSWEGDRGDTHDYFRYTNGAWQREGGVRRDAQATIDEDELRGSTGVNSTIYESRVTFMLDDPDGVNAVAGFAEFGCMLTCHDNSRTMPTWVNADGEVHKYLPDSIIGRLDLWHHRLGRANPIGLSDDQWVGQRINDEGDGGGQGEAPREAQHTCDATGAPGPRTRGPDQHRWQELHRLAVRNFDHR